MVAFPLPPGSSIGIIGGGQLGRMSAMAAARLGYAVVVLSDHADCPAGQVASRVIAGAYDDSSTLRQFAEAVDIITFEFENISAEGLALLSSLRPVRPSEHLLRISQDRISEKKFLFEHGLPLAQWCAVETLEDAHIAAEKLGFPFIIKTTRFGYDGKGQRRIYKKSDIPAALEELSPHPLVAEQMVRFSCEISVMVVRGANGTLQTFDVSENRHKDGILDITLAPARITCQLGERASELARRIAQAAELVGVMGVEMFVDQDGELKVNELAPRPHNSGHWTMDACAFDQFDMHIRAVAGLPLPAPLRHSDAVMKNLIGPEDMERWPRVLETPDFIPHLYGKKGARPGRKMGHFNILFPRGSLPGEFGIKAALGGFYTEPS